MAVNKNNNETLLSFSKYFCSMAYSVPVDRSLTKEVKKKTNNKKPGKKVTPPLFCLSGTIVWQWIRKDGWVDLRGRTSSQCFEEVISVQPCPHKVSRFLYLMGFLTWMTIWNLFYQLHSFPTFLLWLARDGILSEEEPSMGLLCMFLYCLHSPISVTGTAAHNLYIFQ